MSEMYQRVTLKTGKIVVLRPLEVSHYDTAIEAACHRAGNNQNLLAYYSQKEILKQIIVKVGDKELSAADRELVEKEFTPTEHAQILLVMKEMLGEAEMPKVEMVPSGNK